MRKTRSRQLRARLAALGEAVRVRRTELGMTQEALAEAADLHRTYIGSVERGERNLSVGNLYALADALATTATELMSP